MAVSPELQTLWQHYDILRQSIENQPEIILDAVNAGLMPPAIRERVCSASERAHTVLSIVEGRIATDCTAFQQLIDILTRYPQLTDVVSLLQTAYSKSYFV